MSEHIEAEVNRIARANCSHMCHRIGLNPWVRECPVCGCHNERYDADAIPNIIRPSILDDSEAKP